MGEACDDTDRYLCAHQQDSACMRVENVGSESPGPCSVTGPEWWVGRTTFVLETHSWKCDSGAADTCVVPQALALPSSFGLGRAGCSLQRGLCGATELQAQQVWLVHDLRTQADKTGSLCFPHLRAVSHQLKILPSFQSSWCQLIFGRYSGSSPGWSPGSRRCCLGRACESGQTCSLGLKTACLHAAPWKKRWICHWNVGKEMKTLLTPSTQ